MRQNIKVKCEIYAMHDAKSGAKMCKNINGFKNGDLDILICKRGA